jgi:hypothetical protein
MTQRSPEDEGLDRLLSHLTSVEPDESFKKRVLHGIAARRFGRERRPSLLLLWSFASAAALACALEFAFFAVQKPVRPVPPAVAKVPETVQPPAVAILQPTSAHNRKGKAHIAAQPNVPADFPAPEDPITAEEKLLLRIARHTDPDEVATLNPEERTELELRDQVQFQQFFDPEPRPKRDHN